MQADLNLCCAHMFKGTVSDFAAHLIQGLVVQSIVSLMSSLVVKILTVLVSTISNSQVFFQQNISIYAIFNDQSFKDN